MLLQERDLNRNESRGTKLTQVLIVLSTWNNSESMNNDDQFGPEGVVNIKLMTVDSG